MASLADMAKAAQHVIDNPPQEYLNFVASNADSNQTNSPINQPGWTTAEPTFYTEEGTNAYPNQISYQTVSMPSAQELLLEKLNKTLQSIESQNEQVIALLKYLAELWEPAPPHQQPNPSQTVESNQL